MEKIWSIGFVDIADVADEGVALICHRISWQKMTLTL